jgi:predicted TIM-barrel fold metal-dependent hydrolase
MQQDAGAADSHDLPFSPRPEKISKPAVTVPPLATDCHFHIFGPQERYPLASKRMYNPQEAPVEAYRQMAGTVGIERMVIVQASPYGTDNRCLLDSIALLGAERTRGIAVIDTSTTDAELQRMHQAGVRGIRFNAVSGGTPLNHLNVLAARIAPFGWHIQLWVSGQQIPLLESRLLELPVEFSIDHIGQIAPNKGLSHPEIRSVLRLLGSGRAWIKLSGYRASAQDYPHGDVAEPIRAMIAAAPERCIWGSDWPHPLLLHRKMPDVGRLMDLLAVWAPAPAVFEQILVANPAKLYGFASASGSGAAQ